MIVDQSVFCYVQRRVMELQRASLIIGTPPSTPRNSMLLAAAPPSNSSQMFDLSEFLSKFDPGDTPGTIPENEEFHQLNAAPSREFRTSQQSVSQRSKSSSSLHSAPSQTSISSKTDGMPVIVNPAANANFNNNNNNNLLFSDSTSQMSGPSSSTPNSTSGLADILWKDANYTGNVLSRHSLPNDQLSLTEALAFLEPLNEEDTVMKRSATLNSHQISKSKSSDALKKDAKPKSKSKGLFKKKFHQSTEGVVDEQKLGGKGGKPPVARKASKNGKKNFTENTKQPTLEALPVNEKRRSTPNLSALTDINRLGDLAPVDQPLFKTEKRKSSENIQVKDEVDPFAEVDDCFSLLSQPTSITSIISEEDSLWQEYGPF